MRAAILASLAIAAMLACSRPTSAPPPPPSTRSPAEAHASGTATSDEERRDRPVDQHDLRILVRADELLASPAAWNRHDTRECSPTDASWSLFCALQAASLEVLGRYEHRRVALQEVRFAVEEATAGLQLHHRLMDFNNLPSTRFQDVKRVLAVARERVRARLAAVPP